MGVVDAAQTLVREEVRFVVGGVAGTIHGARRVTEDLDVCYDDESSNVRRPAAVLVRWNAYPRHWPAGLPFYTDERTFRTTPTMTFQTSNGDIAVLHQVEPIGGERPCYVRRLFGVYSALTLTGRMTPHDHV